MSYFWRETLAGVAVSHVENLDCYRMIKDKKTLYVQMSTFVAQTVDRQPWYYRYPIKIFAFWLGLLCVLTMRRSLRTLSVRDRQNFLRCARFIPPFTLIHTFAQSVAFFCIFDHPSLAALMPH